jgi:C-terminal processing protease CtpA/Prc
MSQYEQGARAIHAYEDLERLWKPRWAEFGDELAILKFPNFFFDFDAVQSWIEKARKHKALIIDLRANGGGAEETLQNMLGGVFDHEVRIGDRIMRNDRKPLMAKPQHPFEGRIIVLIDSESKSAAEIFARVIQIEKRGLVMGDRSAGSVMEARYYPYQLFGSAIYYGVSITQASLVMADGKSLEHVGVMPDEAIVPAASDLAKGLDPVLAHAADAAGVKLSPEQAGKLFPYEWSPE